MKRVHKVVLVTVALLVLILVVPSAILNALDMPGIASIAPLAGLVVFIVGLQSSWRIAVAAAGVFTVFAMIAVAVTGNAWLSALVMAVLAAGLGLSTRWGLDKALIIVPILMGFLVNGLIPSGITDLPPWLVTGLVCAIFSMWGVLVLMVAGKRLPRLPRPTGLSMSRTRVFTIAITAMVSIATWCVVHFEVGHPGGWLLLTIFIVFQPFIQDAFSKSLARAGGTVLGFVLVFAVGSVTSSIWLIYLIGTAAAVLTMYAMFLKWPYWQYATFLTATVVFLESEGSNVLALDRQRLAATVIGVLFSLGVIAVLYPFARRSSIRHGEARF